MANEVIKNDTTISLSWIATGTIEVAVSKYIDFSDGTGAYSGTTTGTTVSFTDNGGNSKRYWRIRVNAGSGYSPWKEINSYYLDTTAAADVALASDSWLLINAVTVTDTYTFEINPVGEQIIPENLARSSNRNLLGTLLNQFITVKAKIRLDYSRQTYIGVNGKAEFQRFYNMRDDKYLAKRSLSQDGVNYLYRIWKVDFAEPLPMEDAGELVLSFEEV